MNKMFFLAATILAASSVQAASVTLTNGDFEATTQNNFGGFDSAPDIPGWSNYGTVSDGGVELAGWWGTYNNGRSAFIASAGGNGAYNLSDYTIQAGDVFTLSFVGKSWGAASQIKYTLFFDAPGTPISPTNVISTFTQNVTGSPYQTYTFDSIVATAGSVGGKLGVIIEKPTGQDAIAWDDVTLSVTSAIPEPSTYGIAAGGLALVGAMGFRRRRAKA